MIRVIVDAQLPPAICLWFDARGIAAWHVVDLGLIAASDREIAAAAEERDAFIVTKDQDFLVLRLPDRFGLLWLRCGNTTNAALRDWLDARWETVDRLLAAGERLIEVR